MMIFCKQCGVKNEKNVAFCRYCGQKLKKVEETSYEQKSEQIDKPLTEEKADHVEEPVSSQRNDDGLHQKKNRKKRVVVSILLVVIILATGLYVGLDYLFDPNRQLDQLEQAIIDEDYAYLMAAFVSDAPMTEKTLSPMIAALKKDESKRQELMDNLAQYIKGNQSSVDYFIEPVLSDTLLNRFPVYAYYVNPVELTVSVPLEGTDVTVADFDSITSVSMDSTYTFTLLPGLYQVKGHHADVALNQSDVLVNFFTEETDVAEVNLDRQAPSIIFTANEPEATLYINGDNEGEIGLQQEITGFDQQAITKVNLRYAYPFGEAISEEMFVTFPFRDRYHLEIGPYDTSALADIKGVLDDFFVALTPALNDEMSFEPTIPIDEALLADIRATIEQESESEAFDYHYAYSQSDDASFVIEKTDQDIYEAQLTVNTQYSKLKKIYEGRPEGESLDLILRFTFTFDENAHQWVLKVVDEQDTFDSADVNIFSTYYY